MAQQNQAQDRDPYVCVVCHFTMPYDDVAVTCAKWHICTRCMYRETQTNTRLSDSYEKELKAVINGIQ